MKILILGDVCGPAGRKIIKEKLPQIIKKKKIDFVILNGENADDSGVGITKKIFDEFLEVGANVITTGNHVWDQKEAMEFIKYERRLLRPANLIQGSPGNGEYYLSWQTPKLYFLINFIYKSPEYFLASYIVFFFILIRSQSFFKKRFNFFTFKLILLFSIMLIPICINFFVPLVLYDGIRLFLWSIPYFSIIP